MGRGCGNRVRGGVYIESRPCRRDLGEICVPLDWFLVDPALPVPEGLDIPARGITIAERVVNGHATGIFDVYDHIGSKHYPNVEDFIVETRRKGLSRRIAINEDFSKLTHQSLIVLVHSKAIVKNAGEVYAALAKEAAKHSTAYPWSCRCNVPAHNTYVAQAAKATLTDAPTCTSLYRELVGGGEDFKGNHVRPRSVKRTVGDVTYAARKPFKGLDMEYERGIFLRLPISNLAVIKDPVDGRDAEAMERASQSGLDVTLEDA